MSKNSQHLMTLKNLLGDDLFKMSFISLQVTRLFFQSVLTIWKRNTGTDASDRKQVRVFQSLT